MSEKPLQSQNLNAGEFYGHVPQKRCINSSIITEVVHTKQISVPRHSHELGHFQLLLSGSYSETFGGKSVSSSPMTISWHRPGITHRDEIGQGGGKFFMVEIQPSCIGQLEQLARLPEDFYIRNHALVWLAGRLYNEFKNWQLGSELISEGITLEMLAHLARKDVKKENRPPA